MNKNISEAISDIENKRFSDFAQKVRVSLEDKLRNNPTIQAKGAELKSFENMKDLFAQIKQ